MSDGSSFYGSPMTGGRRDLWVVALVIVLLVAGIGIAIAKPWANQAEPAPPSGLPQAVVTSPTASSPTIAPQMPSAFPSASVGPSHDAFTTALPPASAAWTGLTWRRLAPDDPLNLVTSVVRWHGGYIALGWDGTSLPRTPVWTSTDGATWDPLPFNTSRTFWPGTLVLAVAEVSGGLVALTETAKECGAASCPLTLVPPVVSWTSPDGREWTPGAPIDWLTNPTGGQPLVAVGPAGLVAASSGPSAHLATSADGIDWQALPASTLPATFWLDDLRGTGTGYVVVGHQVTSDTHPDAASMWSAGGRHWSRTPTLLPIPGLASGAGSTVLSLVAGRDGVVGVGRDVGERGAFLWWQSSDGRRWTSLPTFQPLGPTTCSGEGCGVQPNGTLVGDGHRMVAVRGGADAAAWTSTDGLTWGRLHVAGDLPGEQATKAVLLPGGVVLSDGTTSWYGEAQGNSAALAGAHPGELLRRLALLVCSSRCGSGTSASSPRPRPATSTCC